jgi:hypothetical protein
MFQNRNQRVPRFLILALTHSTPHFLHRLRLLKNQPYAVNSDKTATAGGTPLKITLLH